MGLFIGICYDAKQEYIEQGFSHTEVMEFDDEQTIIGLENTLCELGHRVERIGTGKKLAHRLVNGDRWDLVFNIAEGVKGRSREAQVPAICELFEQAYTFSDPLTCALTLDKALAKRIVRDHGLATAPFIVINHVSEVANIDLPMPLFCKPVAEGSSKGITGKCLVKEKVELVTTVQALLEEFQQPIIVETFLPGREVTVGIVGNGNHAKVVGIMEVIFTHLAETAAYTGSSVENLSYLWLS
jgi:D-alanine-D-alanine ligase